MSTPTTMSPGKVDEAIKYIRSLHVKGKTIGEIFNKISVKFPGIISIGLIDGGGWAVNSDYDAVLEVLREIKEVEAQQVSVPTTVVTPAARATRPASLTTQHGGSVDAKRRRLRFDGDDSEDSTETVICIGERAYTVTITEDLIRNRQVDTSKVKTKAVVKKVGDDYFIVFNGREVQVPDDDVPLYRVVTRTYETQGDIDRKPSPVPMPVDPSELEIGRTGDKKEDDDIEEEDSTSSEAKPEVKTEVDYGEWFAKAEGRESCKKILKKIKERPALTALETAKVDEQYNKYHINAKTDACYLFVAIEGVVSKLYRNWKRDLTKTVVYEMLYRYMETHQVILKNEGIQNLLAMVKKNSPSFKEPDKLFTKADGFLYRLKK